MDNPYQPPDTPLTAPPAEGPAERSVTIDTPKGPARLEQRGDTITLVFGIIRKEIPAEKFASNIIMHFTRTKRISFKPISLYSVAVSEERFREVLDFYGIERFQQHDVKNMRLIHGFSGALFIFLALMNKPALGTWSLFAAGLLGFGLMSLILCVLTFFRGYRLFWCFSIVTNLLLTVVLTLLVSSASDWWVLIPMLFLFFSMSTSVGRIRYFSFTPAVERVD